MLHGEDHAAPQKKGKGGPLAFTGGQRAAGKHPNKKKHPRRPHAEDLGSTKHTQENNTKNVS